MSARPGCPTPPRRQVEPQAPEDRSARRDGDGQPRLARRAVGGDRERGAAAGPGAGRRARARGDRSDPGGRGHDRTTPNRARLRPRRRSRARSRCSSSAAYSGGGAGGSRPEFAAAAIRVAEANPRLLVTAPGWKIVRADEFEPDSGELTFSDGSRRFEIHWYPAPMYEEYLRRPRHRQRARTRDPARSRTTTVDYGREEYATMLSPQGSVFIEVRGQLGSRSAYDGILHSLKPVDVDTWLSAMPPSTVRPEARAEAVEQLLRESRCRPASTPPRSRAKGRSPTGTLSRSRSETQSRAAGPRAGSRPGPAVTMPPRSERWPRSRTRGNGRWSRRRRSHGSRTTR